MNRGTLIPNFERRLELGSKCSRLFKPVKPPPLFLPRDAGEDEGGGLSRCFVTNDFDVVAVRIEDEGAVVVRMIMRPQTRRAVIFSSGSEGGLMKSVN